MNGIITTVCSKALDTLFLSSGYTTNMESRQEVISRLKFIGSLREGEKLHTKRLYVQPDGILTSLSRTFFNPDSRSNALAFIRDTITRSFEIIDMYEKSADDSKITMCCHILHDLKQAEVGLCNFKQTYITDTKFSCDIDTLLQVIRIKVAEMEKRFPTAIKEKLGEVSAELMNSL